MPLQPVLIRIPVADCGTTVVNGSLAAVPLLKAQGGALIDIRTAMVVASAMAAAWSRGNVRSGRQPAH